MDLTFLFRFFSFSQAGGIIEITASTNSKPSSYTLEFKVWSNLQESDWPFGLMMDLFRANAIADSDNLFFLSVFNSPLCAINLKGCAIVG